MSEEKKPLIQRLLEVLENEEAKPVTILPNGEIGFPDESKLLSPGKKPLTFRENLGGEYA